MGHGREVVGRSLREIHGQERVLGGVTSLLRPELGLADKRFLAVCIAGVGLERVRGVLCQGRADKRANELVCAVLACFVVLGHEPRIVQGRVGIRLENLDAVTQDDIVVQAGRVRVHLVRGDGEGRSRRGQSVVARHPDGGVGLHRRGKAARFHGGRRIDLGALVVRAERPRLAKACAFAEIHAVDGHDMGCRIDVYQLALVGVVSVGGVPVQKASPAVVAVVVPFVLASLRPEVVGERGSLNKGAAVVLVDRPRVGHGDVRVP